MSKHAFFPIVARLSAASAVFVVAVSTVLALPVAGHCRSQYEHMDITASPIPIPTPSPSPDSAAPYAASSNTGNGAALTALLSTTFLGFVASKRLARTASKKGL